MSREQGQAAVELLGSLPALLLALVIVWQLALAGHAAWLAAHAARVAARAELVGEDGAAAARSALPVGLEGGLEITRTRTGATRVRVPVPLVHHAWSSRLKIAASASLEAEQ